MVRPNTVPVNTIGSVLMSLWELYKPGGDQTALKSSADYWQAKGHSPKRARTSQDSSGGLLHQDELRHRLLLAFYSATRPITFRQAYLSLCLAGDDPEPDHVTRASKVVQPTQPNKQDQLVERVGFELDRVRGHQPGLYVITDWGRTELLQAYGPESGPFGRGLDVLERTINKLARYKSEWCPLEAQKPSIEFIQQIKAGYIAN
jgi:hypothetical protein